ncbi:MAG: transglutaminase family protein [Actinobacteria bacterium]|nr:transglutaminase family protein [Actinomycetota bacterium]
MTYRVTHRTTYRYDGEVSSSYGQMHVLPRDLPGGAQVCRATTVVIDPVPDDYRERRDFFGNRVAYFEIRSAHRVLSVTATTDVDVYGAHAMPLLAEQSWEQTRELTRAGTDPDALEARQYLLDSPLVAASADLAEYARPSFTPGRPALDALRDLAGRIHDDFTYEPGATAVTTKVDEVLAGRRGVCQDFAHLAIGCLRSVGLAGRYVSGYLETTPQAGGSRLVGADVSHAWASLYVPPIGWVHVDPTNDQLVDDHYVTTAWGRDYGDVPPLKGVVFTEAREHELEVVVDVARLESG